jgi:hypothetical protein
LLSYTVPTPSGEKIFASWTDVRRQFWGWPPARITP